MFEADTETEQERRVREFWSKAYDSLIVSKDKLPYEPTAVLTAPNNNNKKPFRLSDILDLDLTRL
jgi:hypothetical protein